MKMLTGVLSLSVCASAMAEGEGFFDGAKADLMLRNYYFNRDFALINDGLSDFLHKLLHSGGTIDCQVNTPT